ncbi:EscU/YscU/HrcU family type III secretion system export apparatus switch protein [Amnibacterium kyonggiense]|uniref:Flagellar biosynthetic protein FlhB n=1 Tax=Amnibacterium kyonggiense TaxID=595671 RepID=A0A4R7FR30_9MICO|nr:EscU/YscU/HrcU family type III secretion system export apparatus switch protein [Amnibacterium kyonggiense]TDS80089.1 flagellar biosynthetic protein FlhB [Amnibacterium kyonggiense]
MPDQPSGERTEKATPKRLEEARREGRIQRSRDMPSWLSMGAAALTLPLVIGNGAAASRDLVLGVKEIIADPTASRAQSTFLGAFGVLPGVLAPVMAAAVVGAIAGSLASGGFSMKRFKPHFDQFDVVKGAGRLVGKQALWEGAKALLKTGVVGVAVWTAIQGAIPLLSASGAMPVSAVVSTASGIAVAILQAAIVAGVVLGAIDVLVVSRRNRQHTMMTKQEIKDESKSTEGDPHIRQQRRSRAIQISRNRMMAAIAGADVVMLNPTHVAVALKYEPGKSAPRVVAKGAGEVAARIRERAAEHRVPMVQDIPLARALYAACQVDQEIPEELYGAVARVLAFVMSLKRRGAALGVHRLAS